MKQSTIIVTLTIKVIKINHECNKLITINVITINNIIWFTINVTSMENRMKASTFR